ncbi:heavy-metal-associated domain-containing protein [Granulicatella seriolae]|uniref:Heavy-metal-associated domain-containing protein n=1 Tax=Granulicatella seriolae TaxID=2967226 RepID=A0ABT1WNN1_9LACT|nr:heavy metal-associated domain-containing protein [Granulicatella seriolae]
MMQTITIEQMHCQNCANTVTRNFKKMEGVQEVTVNLEAKQAKVQTDLAHSKEDYAAALESTPYQVTAVS